MSQFIAGVLTCFTGTDPPLTQPPPPPPPPAEKPTEKHQPPTTTTRQPRLASDIATDILNALLHTEKPYPHLRKTLDAIVGTTGWTEEIAKWTLAKLEEVLRCANNQQQKQVLRGPLKEAYDKACEVALQIPGFVVEHPVFVTVVALGVLVCVAPWVLGVLGFGELGPVEGSFAAAWQARYAGYVPQGSLFSFFQRLGMVWH